MRTNRRKMMNSEVDLKVEYIMTNGNQYILTDWIPLIDTKIEMYFHIKDSLYKDGMNNTIFNCRDRDNNIVFGINNGDRSNEFNTLYLWNNKSYSAGGRISKINIDDYINTQTPLLLYMSKDSVGYYQNKVFTKMSLELRTQPCTTPLTLLFTKESLDHCYNRAKR